MGLRAAAGAAFIGVFLGHGIAIGIVIFSCPRSMKASQNVPNDTARDTIEMGMLINSMPIGLKREL